MKKSLRQESLEKTRMLLMAVARRHFARRGYAATDLVAIARDARVTTGAIYHHFAGKKELLQAVAEQIEVEILEARPKVAEGTPRERMNASLEVLVDFCAAPDIQRITFIEAPHVIGLEAWKEIEMRYAYGAMHANLQQMMSAGIMRPFPIDLVAGMILALLRETSGAIARSKRDSAVRAQVSVMIAAVLDSLFASG